MRILVTGGRDYVDRFWDDERGYWVYYIGPKSAKMKQVLDVFVKPDDVIVHGAAKGADSMADDYAKANGILPEPHPADWDTHGKRAGYLRNQEMLDTGIDKVIAFPGGKGTAMMVQIAEKAGVPVVVVE